MRIFNDPFKVFSWGEPDPCLVPVQTKKAERESSSSEGEDDKEEKKVTIAYKSTRSAVSGDYSFIWHFIRTTGTIKYNVLNPHLRERHISP